MSLVGQAKKLPATVAIGLAEERRIGFHRFRQRAQPGSVTMQAASPEIALEHPKAPNVRPTTGVTRPLLVPERP